MKHGKVFLFLLGILICWTVYSRPAHKGIITLVQPDGSTFRARFRGDEFMRIKTTEEGGAIVQDKDGWWCYALYDGSGVKVSSGCRVLHDCPSDIVARSSDIPYRRLSELASGSRKQASQRDDEPVLKRMRDSRATLTRSDENGDQVMIKHGIVILAEFADLSFKHTREDFERMLNQDGYALNGATGCAREYFDSQLGGKVQFSFDVSEIVHLSRNLAYYGENTSSATGVESDKAASEMVMEACQLAEATVDFSKYDDDGDGEVDNVFVFFSGGDEAEGAGDDCIWSHAWYLQQGAGKNLVLDGKVIDRYACTSEMTRFLDKDGKIDQKLAGIGTFCHEYAHTFGLADMYDTDYEGSGGQSEALWGCTSIMDGGNQNNGGNTPPFFNAIEREMLGMSEPEIIAGDGSFSMYPIHKGGAYYRINTDEEHEYFLIESRAEQSWDAYIGGSGMLVYHIDKSFRLSGYSDAYGMDLKARQRWSYYNEVNCRPDHQCADLLEAVSDASNVRSVFFPSGTVNEIPAERMMYWSGAIGLLSLTAIRKDGDAVHFNVVGNSLDTTPPVPVGVGYDKFQDAAILSFESDRPFDGEALVVWGKTGKETSSTTLKPYQTGKYALLLEGLEPRTSYTVAISFSINGVSGKEAGISFLTNTDNGGYPYIYLKNVQRNPDGSFPSGSRLPLRIYNAVGAERVVWSLNGSRIKPDATGYHTLTEGGILKAVVSWEDGSEDVIIKEITVK